MLEDTSLVPEEVEASVEELEEVISPVVDCSEVDEPVEISLVVDKSEVGLELVDTSEALDEKASVVDDVSSPVEVVVELVVGVPEQSP